MGAGTVQLLGTVVGVMGQVQKARGESQAANYNASISEANAALSLEQGDAAALQQQRTGSMAMGSIRAAYGASGVRSDTGSPMDALAASAAQSQLDVDNVKYNALLKSRGLSNSANLDRARASNAMSSGLYTAAGQAILGGGKAYALANQPSGAGTPIPVYGHAQNLSYAPGALAGE